ncbi:MAG: prepilin-type N-terminal cleavage/methylation domain-containing protein [Francisellaceae bacterium]|nr:prepilin-type N-terminal cleavage/methylation domain-containing protein [Francisellaceae bacterium]
MKGFTLIETVLVISLIGILAVIAAPRFANVLTFSTNTFFEETLNSVRYGQQLAVGMGCDIQVTISPTTVALNARANCSTGNFTQAIRDPALGASSYLKTAPSGVTISNTNFPIYFDPLGRSHDVASGNVSDASLTIATRTLQVVGETGFTYVP